MIRRFRVQNRSWIALASVGILVGVGLLLTQQMIASAEAETSAAADAAGLIAAADDPAAPGIERAAPPLKRQWQGARRVDQVDHPQARAAVDAAREDHNRYRLTEAVDPPRFDEAELKRRGEGYLADYLKETAPGRVYQVKEPGRGVPALVEVGPLDLELPEDGAVRLRVRAAPEAPVTFATQDLGVFDNGLTSITVLADRRGLAAVRFNATPNLSGRVTVMAGSPVCSDTVAFDLVVVE